MWLPFRRFFQIRLPLPIAHKWYGTSRARTIGGAAAQVRAFPLRFAVPLQFGPAPAVQLPMRAFTVLLLLAGCSSGGPSTPAECEPTDPKACAELDSGLALEVPRAYTCASDAGRVNAAHSGCVSQDVAPHLYCCP
jgi:hypothetical protein